MIPMKIMEMVCKATGMKLVPIDSVKYIAEDLEGYARMLVKEFPGNHSIADYAHDLRLVADYLEEMIL
jgi:hypothetical protein